MIKGNESAIPEIITELEHNGVENTYSYGGLTIRQHFAAMAMQGILANPEFLANHKDVDIHSLSVFNADALITELNKEK